MTMPADAAPTTPQATPPVSPWKLPRGRFLAVLAGLAVVMVIAATLSLMGERARTAARFAPVAFFPGLDKSLDQAAKVTLTSKDGTIVMAMAPDKKWVASSLENYPVDGKKVRVLLLSLAGVTAVEQKTAQPALHEALGLGAPDAGGSGTRIEVDDASGRAIAALIVGKEAPGATAGEDRFYARRASEDQTYVVRGTLAHSADVSEWLETTIADISRDRVKSVDVTPAEGPAYRVSRAQAEDANFVLENVPQGRVPLNDTVANATGAALADLKLDSVQKADALDFSKAGHDVFETFDGLTVTLDVLDIDNAFWVRLNAAGTGDADKEAAAFNARVGGWAYKLSEWKGEILMRARERLLKSPDAAKSDGDGADGLPQ